MISCGENRGCAEQRSFQLGKTSHGETPPSIHNPKLLCPHGWFPSLLCLFAQGYTLDPQIFLKATKKAALLLKPHLDLPVLLACCWYLFTAQPLKSRISPGSAKSHLPMINGQSHSWYFNRINFHPCSAQLCWNNLWFSTFPWEGKCEDTVPSSLQLTHKDFSSPVCSRAPWVGNIADVHSWALNKRCKLSIFCLLGIHACSSWNFTHWNSLAAGIMLKSHMLALENFWVA